MSIPDEPIFLTSDEQAEYERGLQQLKDPRWHDYGKCGQPLEYRPDSTKRHRVRFHRQYCPVHKVLVDMSGYEIGHSLGTDSRAMNGKSSS